MESFSGGNISKFKGCRQFTFHKIYAHTDTEQKRKAIEEATSSDSPLNQKLNAKRFTVTDDDMLRKLYGLK